MIAWLILGALVAGVGLLVWAITRPDPRLGPPTYLPAPEE